VVPNLFRADGKNVPTFHVAGKFSRREGGCKSKFSSARSWPPYPTTDAMTSRVGRESKLGPTSAWNMSLAGKFCSPVNSLASKSFGPASKFCSWVAGWEPLIYSFTLRAINLLSEQTDPFSVMIILFIYSEHATRSHALYAWSKRCVSKIHENQSKKYINIPINAR